MILIHLNSKAIHYTTGDGYSNVGVPSVEQQPHGIASSWQKPLWWKLTLFQRKVFDYGPNDALSIRPDAFAWQCTLQADLLASLLGIW